MNLKQLNLINRNDTTSKLAFTLPFQTSPRVLPGVYSAHSTVFSDAMSADPLYNTLQRANDIRLLHLLPGDGDLIFVEMIEVSLDNALDYEALSYTWDLDNETQDDVPQEIILNNQRFSIGANLYAALRQIRHADKLRIFWIDAICINQSDVDERSAQVLIMSKIYSKAQLVVVWLGEAYANDEFAFDALYRFWQRIENEDDELDLLGEVWSDVVGHTHAPYWSALGALLCKRWFTRVWILQEIVVAQQALVMCGPHNIPWCEFEEVIRLFRLCTMEGLLDYGNRNPRRPLPGLLTVHLIRYMRNLLKYGEKSTMLELVTFTRRLHATDPRDKLYSLFSLLNIDDPPPTDYKRSFEDIFQDFNISLVRKDQNLHLLSLFDKKSLENPSSTGSWAPNWLLVEEGRNSFAEGNTHFKSTANRPVEARFSDHGKKLTLRGILLETVLVLGKPRDMEVIFATADVFQRNQRSIETNTAFIQSAKSVTADACSSLYPGQSLEEALARTLICNTDLSISPASKEFANGLEVFVETLNNMSQNNIMDYRRARASRDYEMALGRVSGGRVVCRTEDGYIGMVPCSTQAGDKICAFLGADTPFVIRDKGDRNWQLIGECYIHGMMYGEILEFPDFEERLQDIVLY
jgi:hypothetical protein